MLRTSYYFTGQGITKISIGLILLIAIISLYYLFNHNLRLWYFSIFLVLVYFFSLSQKRHLKPSMSLLIFCLVGAVSITSSYYLFDRFEGVLAHNNVKTYQKIVNQYLWFIAFFTLPTVYCFGKFNARYFFNTFFAINIFSLIYITYQSSRLDFNRGQLAMFFDPIISFDMTFTALALLNLGYAFHLKNKIAYVFIFISCMCVFILMMHGSRGTWMGLPIALFILSCIYLKTQPKKIILISVLSGLFLVANAMLPHSPIWDRVQNLKSDAALIENQSFENSTGTRLLLWENSIELFKQAPIWGVGMYHIEQNNCQFYADQRLERCFQHQHSLFFQELAAHGMIGVLGLLLSFVIPMIYFTRHMWRQQDAWIKNLATIGIIFVIYHAVSGLTEYYLFFKYPAFLFFFIVASLMSFIQIAKQAKTSTL